MTTPTSNLRGIVLMVLATAVFISNDTLLKIATQALPPYETLAIRGLFSVVLGIPVLWFTGTMSQIRHIAHRGVMIRSVFEFMAAAGYILAIAFAPLADITALAQMTPMLVTLGAVLFFGDRIGWVGGALVVVAFIGALLVAQPGGSGFQPFALLGLWSALCVAIRDLIGRNIPREVPALVVAVAASVVSLIGFTVVTLLFESGAHVMPDAMSLLAIAGSAAFITLGQLLLFTAYRVGEMKVVVPFFYTGTIWALISGAVIFNTMPNMLALTGMALIAGSGVAVMLLDSFARRKVATA
jgi:drug/metabolite transporter (DMT)-like permease